MRYEIDTTKILNQLFRYIWVMVLAFAVGATGGYVYMNNIKADTYTAQLSLVVNSPYDDPSGVNVAKSIIKTAVTVMRSETFIGDNIIEKGGIDMTVSEIKGISRFSIEEEALIAYIRVTADAPEKAYNIANAFYNADYSYINEKVEGCTVSTIDPPVMPEKPNEKSTTYTGFMTGLVTAILSAVAIVLITVFDTRIKSEDDLANLRGDVPIVGVIPSFNQVSSSYGKYGRYEYSYSYGYDTRHNGKGANKEGGEKK
ncbi:MAG: hypothetical protein IJ519_01370 [Clostridia bacterium]|nr:hypothetical protein [Clostridia bacterium]